MWTQKNVVAIVAKNLNMLPKEGKNVAKLDFLFRMHFKLFLLESLSLEVRFLSFSKKVYNNNN